MDKSAKESPGTFQAAYREHLEQERTKTGKVASALVVFLMPVGVSLDYFVYRDRLVEFFFLRIFCSMLAVVIWVLFYSPWGRRNSKYLSLPIALLPALFISIMIFQTEGLTSPYYAGLNLILLAISVVVHWGFLESVIAVASVLGMYLFACLLNVHPSVLQNGFAQFFNNIYFLVLTGVIVVAGNTLFSQLRYREFSLRFELDQNKQKLEDTNDQLVELNRVKDRFFANISHELRTPLTLMIAPLETMLYRLKESLNPEMREMLKGMQFNAMRLLKLINDLLDLVRLESGRMEARKDPLDLVPFVNGLRQSARQVAEDKKIDLICAAEDGLGIVLADRDKLEKVFLNLLFNALKFTPENGRVELRARREGEELIFTVEDTGIGIPQKSLPHIFDRFWQADGSAKRKFQGVGIGLSLVKELIEVQEGSVSVESEVDQGTKFTIRLPYSKGEENPLMPDLEEASAGDGETGASADADKPGMQSQEWIANLYRRAELFPALGRTEEETESEPTGSQGEEDAEEELQPKRHTILIADDEPQMRSFLNAQLKKNYQVVKVEDGQQAVDKALEIIPDIILLDLMMPNKDGLQACKEIRENPRTHQVPIILLTARADEEAKLNALSAGASDFLSKPFSTTELHVRIQNLVKSHDFQKELGNKNNQLGDTIEQLKETETQLVQTEKLASLGRMSAGIIHEINNPLNYTSTGLALLKKMGEKLPEGDFELFSEMVRDIEEGVRRVQGIVTDLKTFTHPDAATIQDVSAAELIENSLRLVSNQLDETIEVVQETDDSVRLRVNKNRMIQVLVNLIQNSIDAVKKRTGSADKEEDEARTIWISAVPENESCVFRVRDNGDGADAETLSKIFDPFFTTKEVGEGMGLGLSICYRIIEQMGGRIHAQSEKGRYFELTITVPLARSQPALPEPAYA